MKRQKGGVCHSIIDRRARYYRMIREVKKELSERFLLVTLNRKVHINIRPKILSLPLICNFLFVLKTGCFKNKLQLERTIVYLFFKVL